MQTSSKRVLTVFSLAMINIIAVDNLRGLPVSAEYGFSLIFYYLAAALLFFIPTALISAELATGWPRTGGVYVWVREAFGTRWAFLVIWLQWIYNVVWFPTMMAFLAGMVAYLFFPQLANSKIYMFSVVLILFWLATWINMFGMKTSSFMSTTGALIGTIVPMTFIAILGIIWVALHKPMQIMMNWHSFWPDLKNFNNLAFLVSVVFALMGMKMSAVHAEEVRNAQRDYPRALLYSTMVILISLIFASLAIAIVVPHTKISLVTGMVQAFDVLFKQFNLTGLTPLMIVLIIIGGSSGVSAWVLGPIKGLLVASRDGSIPPSFQQLNKHQSPYVLLVVQGIIVSLLSSLFLFMPTVNTSYWILSALTAQLALLFYILLFAAAIKLRYSHPEVKRAYKIPGGNIVMWLIGGAGIIVSIAIFIFGFLPPPGVKIGSLFRYEAILISGCLISIILPFIIYAYSKPHWAQHTSPNIAKSQ